MERGGAIEVFADPADAQARAKYIESVTKSMPTLPPHWERPQARMACCLSPRAPLLVR
ncbi:hypothetical protein [Streptomyces sp. NPDC056817]|uniref:hypothetical protein n=1 Tax=Streptomyces sp. NPDC056817 TaxID=3345950 RepID=UPI00369D878A